MLEWKGLGVDLFNDFLFLDLELDKVLELFSTVYGHLKHCLVENQVSLKVEVFLWCWFHYLCSMGSLWDDSLSEKVWYDFCVIELHIGSYDWYSKWILISKNIFNLSLICESDWIKKIPQSKSCFSDKDTTYLLLKVISSYFNTNFRNHS